MRSKKNKDKAIDGFLKWSPWIAVVITAICKEKTVRTAKQTIVTAAGCVALQYVVVETLKKVVNERRPHSFKTDSFPSGHTSASFAGAEMLRTELKHSNPVLSYGGYVLAIITGIRRLKERKHWFQDIAGGTVLGIISTYTSKKIFSHFYKSN